MIPTLEEKRRVAWPLVQMVWSRYVFNYQNYRFVINSRSEEDRCSQDFKLPPPWPYNQHGRPDGSRRYPTGAEEPRTLAATGFSSVLNTLIINNRILMKGTHGEVTQVPRPMRPQLRQTTRLIQTDVEHTLLYLGFPRGKGSTEERWGALWSAMERRTAWWTRAPPTRSTGGRTWVVPSQQPSVYWFSRIQGSKGPR